MAKSLRRRVVSRLLVFGLVLALIMGVAYTGMIEHHFIYFPLRELEADPSDLGLPFDEVYFVTQDGVRLHGWFVPGEKDLVWLWCHGNAGNISHRLENLALLHQELGISIFLFDYRGYGRSEGTRRPDTGVTLSLRILHGPPPLPLFAGVAPAPHQI